MTNAAHSQKPGRSVKHQLRDRVTKMRAWLMMLTCRYRADIISSVLPRRDLTWKVFCIATHTQEKYYVRQLVSCSLFMLNLDD
jgi:hypothetical protein